MTKAAFRLLAVAFLLALAACSGADPVQLDSSSTQGSIDGAPPATEDPGALEQPLPPRDGNPGISVATLPVGGQGGGSGTDGVQCVQVNWLLSTSQDAIPAGLAVEITGAAFEPDAYVVTDGSCEGPPCIDYIFQASEVACDLPIRPSVAGATELSDSEEVSVSVQGRVLCTDYDAAPCRTFVEAVRGDPQTISVGLPLSPEAPPDSTGSDPSTAPPGADPSPGG